MQKTFETLGNASVQFAIDSKPVLITDPWLVGTCYFGSWALDHPLTQEQIDRVFVSDYIWISHGHPDHLHHDSLKLLPKGKTILIPDHFDRDIYNFLMGEGFRVEILPYRAWRRLSPEMEILCIDNENQDAILVVRLGDALVLNLNDSPFCGEFGFLRGLVHNHPNDRVYVLQLCSIDADMLNFVDDRGNRTIEPPEEYKPGAIRAVARKAELLGAKYFCCSSSQHIYARPDSIWANPYRILYDEIRHYWDRQSVKIVPPYVTMDAQTGHYVENYPEGTSDISQISDKTGDDDWNERLSGQEWDQVAAFFRRFELLKRRIDFIEVSVGGESRRFATRPSSPLSGGDGVTFYVPRRSLIEAVTYGYFDDLLIGNFMKTQLHGRAKLYPYVTPIIAKLGGNARVFTHSQYYRFLWRYLRRNPVGFVQWRLEQWLNNRLLPWMRVWSQRLGIFDFLKRIYRGWILDEKTQ